MRVHHQSSDPRPSRLFTALRRPEYLLNPRQIWRRLQRRSLCNQNALQLAWGLPVEVDPSSIVGQDIVNIGLYDRVVLEAIYRLLDAGETAFDVGANIGQNASIMALVVGSGGRVIAFEPGPTALSMLTKNVESWAAYDLAQITVVRKGLSSRSGVGVLHESLDLGGFSLEDHSPGPPRIAPEGARGIPVELTTLDDFHTERAEIGLIKIDVEGHELAVLEGAGRILEQKLVRDIVFEDYYAQPSPVTERLQAAGYVVFALLTAWHKPILLTLDQLSRRSRQEYDVTNFLATRDPERARQRFESAGWNCLRLRARLREQSSARRTRKL
jgi:FkbM family methyltransferase